QPEIVPESPLPPSPAEEKLPEAPPAPAEEKLPETIPAVPPPHVEKEEVPPAIAPPEPATEKAPPQEEAPSQEKAPTQEVAPQEPLELKGEELKVEPIPIPEREPPQSKVELPVPVDTSLVEFGKMR